MTPERTDWLRSCSPSAEKAENPPSPVLIETGLPCFPEPLGKEIPGAVRRGKPRRQNRKGILSIQKGLGQLERKAEHRDHRA